MHTIYFKYVLDFYWDYYLLKNENKNNVSCKSDTPNKKNKKMGNQQTLNYIIPESCVYRKECKYTKCKQEHSFGDKSECLHRTLKHPNMNVKEMFVMSNKYTNENQIRHKIKRLRKRISRLEKQL